MALFDRKNYKYYKGLVPSRLPSNFIFCFGSNSTGDHGPVTTELDTSTLVPNWALLPGVRGRVMA